MKSEHRHELKTNELQRLAAQTRPFFEEWGNKILLTLCGVILVAAGVIYWYRSSTAAISAGWTQLTAAGNAEEFANVADKFQGTSVGAWARLMAAQNHLGTGIQLMFTDRAAALSDLKVAEESFQKLLGDSSVPFDVRERALLGMARCLETISDSNTDTAVEAYEKLVRDFPATIYKELAEGRIAALQTQEVKEFYAWFHSQQPKPKDRELPKDGRPDENPFGENFEFDENIIELPSTFPRLPLFDPPGNGPGSTQPDDPDARKDNPAVQEKLPLLRPPDKGGKPARPAEAPKPQ